MFLGHGRFDSGEQDEDQYRAGWRVSRRLRVAGSRPDDDFVLRRSGREDQEMRNRRPEAGLERDDGRRRRRRHLPLADGSRERAEDRQGLPYRITALSALMRNGPPDYGGPFCIPEFPRASAAHGDRV